MANLQDTDLLAVGRGAATYKATFKDIKDNLPAVPDATEAAKGIVELATAAETTTGTDKTRAVHPAGLKVALDKKADDAPNGTTNGTVQYNRQVVTAGSTNTKTWVKAMAEPPNGTKDGTVQYARQVVTAGTSGGSPTNTKSWAPVVIPPGCHVGLTAPTGPKQGQQWWHSGEGRLYIYYDEGGTSGSKQWVAATPEAEGDVFWTRSGTTVSPKTAGDSVDIGSSNILLNADGTAAFGSSVTIGAAAVPPPSHDPAGSLSVTQGDADGARIRLKNTVALNDGGFDVLAVSNTASHGRASELGVYQNSSSSLTGKVAGFIKLPVYNTDDYYYWPDSNGVFRTSTTRTHVGLQQGTVVGSQTSDIRLKRNIADCTYGLDEVTRLQPKTFEYKAAPGVTHAGFIAQEVKRIIPEAVYDTGESIGDDAETKLAMSYVELIPALVNAIKEQSTRIEALEAEVTALKGGSN